MAEGLAVIALTLLLHSAVFLALAWCVERLGWVRHVGVREYLWRSAIVGSLASAALQLVLVPASLPRYHIALMSAASPTLSDLSPPASRNSAPATAAPAAAESLAVGGAVVPGRVQETAAVAAPPRHGAVVMSGNVLRVLLSWLLTIWVLAVLIHWLLVVRSAAALARLLRESVPLVADDWHRDCAELAAGFGLARVPVLRSSDSLASPLATPQASVVVPGWALALPSAQRRALLAHELAHIARRDPQWRLLLALWRGMVCPLPLAALALRRLHALAEWQCDAAAVRATGDAPALAACLVHCLQQRITPSFPALAAAMADVRSPLLQRAERLLEGDSMSCLPLSWRIRFASVAAVAVAVLALPTLIVPASFAAERPSSPSAPTSPAPPAKVVRGCTEPVTGSCRSVVRDNGNLEVFVGDAGHRLHYRSRGEVRFSEQDDGVAALGDGAQVSWEETVGGDTRKIEYTGRGTALNLRYWRNGKEQALDADAQAWIARVVPQLLREAAIDVEGRVARLIARGGNEAVLAEIALIRSDYAQGRYLGELTGKYKLSDSELERALLQIRRIDSAYEKRQVLSVALASQQLGKSQWNSVLVTAADIDSDFERSELLVSIAHQVAGDEALRGAWLRAAEGVESSYERRRSLEALLAVARDDAVVLTIIDAATGIDSDFERRELLSNAAQKARDPNAIALRYATAAARIESDFERREALVALLSAGSLGREGALAVLDATDSMDSDFERREVLTEVVRRVPDDAKVRDRIRQLAANLSDFEREQVEEALGTTRG
ncbi:MAG: hypothetical protein JNN30_07470 [Rhodanobacteraceae bacterium]|nr:hypothetical protein [Rhodanobacteraceae bacterium]